MFYIKKIGLPPAEIPDIIFGCSKHGYLLNNEFLQFLVL